MTKLEYIDAVSEAALTARKCKVIADLFQTEFTSHSSHENAEAVSSSPEMHEYLFATLSDLVFDIYQRLNTLNDAELEG